MDIQPEDRRGFKQLTVHVGGMQLMHPAIIVAYYGGLGLLCMLHFHPLFLLLALLLILVQVKLNGAWYQLRQWRFAYLIMALTILIWNPLFSHRGDKVLFYMKDTPIVLESVVYGFTMMLLVLCVLLLFQNYNKVIDSLKFLYIFSRLSPKVAVMIAMAVRFVPLLRSRLMMIIDVQRTRGISLRQGNIIERLRSGGRLLQIALVWSLEEAMHTADALAAKGYGSGPRSSYNHYRLDLRDIVTLTVLTVLFLLCIAGWFAGYGVMNIYPSLDERVMDNRYEWLQLLVFVVYLVIPIFIEGREKLLWRF